LIGALEAAGYNPDDQIYHQIIAEINSTVGHMHKQHADILGHLEQSTAAAAAPEEFLSKHQNPPPPLYETITNRNPLIFMHIGKTAGTTVLEYLKLIFGPNSIYFDYADKKLGTSTTSLGFSWHAPARVIAGHFGAGKYNNQDYSSLNPRWITWLRDPARRVISHFYYWKYESPNVTDNPIIHQMRVEDWDLITFARHPHMRNLMSRRLRGLELEDFFFIGFTETFDFSMKALINRLGWQVELDDMPLFEPQNVGPVAHREKTVIDDRMMQQLYDLNAEDVDLYNRARRAWISTFLWPSPGNDQPEKPIKIQKPTVVQDGLPQHPKKMEK
jgi:hypothetical protein